MKTIQWKKKWKDLHLRILKEIIQISNFHLKEGNKLQRQRIKGYLHGLETIERTMTKIEKGR